MDDLAFYTARYGILTKEDAFACFKTHLQNYLGADYYVDWAKVLANVARYKAELALLSTLCDAKDKSAAARSLLLRFPQVIPVLPLLMACRGDVTLMDDHAAASVTTYKFDAGQNHAADDVDGYVRFLTSSGLLDLLGRIRCVPDYATGVEVGLDTNGRKNRGGKAGVAALAPFVDEAVAKVGGLQSKSEASFGFLKQNGFAVPANLKGVTWDWALWQPGSNGVRVVVEVNHYASSGSKPIEVSRDYIARDEILRGSGVVFLWVTDGLGWLKSLAPLEQAYHSMSHVINIRLAADGYLPWLFANHISLTTQL